MAYTDIDKPDDYFNTVLYTGTSASNAITVGFQPDLVWIKWRDGSNNHKLQDAIRGITKAISSNTTGAEVTDSPSITSFDTNGFTLGNDGGDYNYTGRTYASWNWLGANSTASNTAGSITSTVSANTTSGFSIVSYTGTGSAGATIGHGLGIAPGMIIAKQTTADDWVVYHQSLGGTKGLKINDTSAEETNSTLWNNTNPSSTVFTVGTNTRANGTNPIIAYCFAEVKGYSKMGSYIGNGSSDGTFVYTGFKPAFVMVKQTNTARYWAMFDNKRLGYNPTNRPLFPNASDQESDSVNYYHDILSNGFKWRTNSNIMNESGGTYIYMAFAENPFVTSTSIPTTAR
jgi:hypothetical protein